MSLNKLILIAIIILSLMQISCSDHETFIEIKQQCNLVTPTDNEIIYTNKPTFTWESVKGADTYILYLNQVQYTETGELFYSIPEEQALEEGNYTWQLRSKNEFQYYPCGTKNFSIIIPSAADLQTPINGECVHTQTPNLQWFDKGGIEYYVVEVSDRKDFSVIIDSSELTETSYTTKPLENGKYYWRVTSYDVNGDIHTSETYSMTINNDFVVAVDLPVPTAIFPIESDIYFQPVTFTWSSEGIGEHFSYEFELFKDGFEDIVFNVNGLQAPIFTLNEIDYKLENGTKYNWRVRAVFYTCTGDWCTENNFNKETISFAEPVNPSNNECVYIDTPTLTWTSGIGIVSYKIEIATDIDFTNIIITKDLLNTNYTTSSLIDGVYYWRIISTDKFGNIYTGSISTFEIATESVPITPELNPVQVYAGTNVKLTWNNGQSYGSYTVEVDTGGSFTTNGISNITPNDCDYQVPVMAGSFNWRVRHNANSCLSSINTAEAVNSLNILLLENCNFIHQIFPSLPTSNYYIDPDTWGVGMNPFQAHCEMVLDDGGWTLVASSVDNSYFATYNDEFGSVAWSDRKSKRDKMLPSSSTGDLSVITTQDTLLETYFYIPFTEQMFSNDINEWITYNMSVSPIKTSVYAWFETLYNGINYTNNTVNCGSDNACDGSYANDIFFESRSYFTATNINKTVANVCSDRRIRFLCDDSNVLPGGNANAYHFGPTWKSRNNQTCPYDDCTGRWQKRFLGSTTLTNYTGTGTALNHASSYIFWYVR